MRWSSSSSPPEYVLKRLTRLRLRTCDGGWSWVPLAQLGCGGVRASSAVSVAAATRDHMHHAPFRGPGLALASV